MENKDIDKYLWDLSKIFINDEEFYKAIDIVNETLEKILKLKGRILSSDKTLLECFTLSDDLNLTLEKVYLYANLGYNDKMNNKEWQEKREKSLSLFDKVSESLSFIVPELLKSNLEDVNKLISNNSDMDKYKFNIELLFRYKPYTLSEEEEKILSSVSPILRTTDDTFSSLNNIDAKFDKIKDENGNMVELTLSNQSRYLESKNRRVRKSTFNKLYKFYSEHINTISTLYINKIKANDFEKSTRKYSSSLEMNLYSDNINKSLYELLINVTNKNVKSLQNYYKLKSKLIGINKLHIYDTYVNICLPTNEDIDYESGKRMVIEALKPIGDEYIKDFKHLLNNRCIDVYPKKAKRSGAYQWGTYAVEPYVSLNYENNIDSVSTLAHEMGHAMHSYYSDKNNIFCYAGYPIFLAEIASTVNEILFSEHMTKNSISIDEKIYYIVEYLDKFKATVFRQTMFAEFENIVHNKYENGESLTKDSICNIYLDLYKKQFGNSLVIDDEIKYEWSRISHFYSSFYVYKYATGFISAMIIASKLLNEEKGFKEKYIKFLSSGGSNYPLEILKELGIDINDEKVIDNAFKLFDEKVNELSVLIEKKR